jgi:hypothetical protein
MTKTPYLRKEGSQSKYSAYMIFITNKFQYVQCIVHYGPYLCNGCECTKAKSKVPNWGIKPTLA